MIEQVEYDPYGRVRRTALGDFDHDGAIATADIFANLAAFNAPSPAADHDWDGAVAPSDIFAFLAHWFAADSTPRDQLSSAGPGGHDNPIGYCGYYHDRETVGIMGDRNGGLYQVRHRVYDPHAGRWLQRDPAGFVDGCNLYEYCMGGPGAGVDPYGQSVCRDFIDGAKQLVDILSGNRAIDDSEWERQRAAQDARNREGMQDAADNGHISQEEADQRHRRYQAGQNADTHQLYRTREFEDDLTTHMIETAVYEAAAGLIGAGVGRGLAQLAKRSMGGMFGRLMDRFRRSTSGCTATPTGVHCWVKHAMGAAGGALKNTLNHIDEYVDLTRHRKSHILNRHRAGSGKPGKSEFPASWSDDRILHHVSDVATDPNSINGVGKWSSPNAIGTRDGIQIRVDFYPPTHPKYPGQISTGYPVNTPVNP